MSQQSEEVEALVKFLRSIPDFMAFPIEKSFDSKAYTKWTGEHWDVCIVFLLVYSTMIRFGPGIMSDGWFLKRKSYEVSEVKVEVTKSKTKGSDGKETEIVTETEKIVLESKHTLTATSLKYVPVDLADLKKPHKLKGASEFKVNDKVVFVPKGGKDYIRGIIKSSSGSDVQIIKRPSRAFDLRIPLAIWNFFLSFFSFIGMMRTAPTLIANLLEYKSIKDTICLPARALDESCRWSESTQSFVDGRPHWGMGPTGFWVMLFINSKLPELVDTLFIVLRMKPLIFLHWYHHITVLLFCWSAYDTNAATGLYFVSMNYTVHAMMYGYYCLQALEMVPKWFPTILITSSQILQMLVGTAVCIAAWYYYYIDKDSCHNKLDNLIAGGLMYASYLYLFVEFAVGKYFRPKGGKGDKEKDV